MKNDGQWIVAENWIGAQFICENRKNGKLSLVADVKLIKSLLDNQGESV